MSISKPEIKEATRNDLRAFLHVINNKWPKFFPKDCKTTRDKFIFTFKTLDYLASPDELFVAAGCSPLLDSELEKSEVAADIIYPSDPTYYHYISTQLLANMESHMQALSAASDTMVKRRGVKHIFDLNDDGSSLGASEDFGLGAEELSSPAPQDTESELEELLKCNSSWGTWS
ncbi:hypothetical protein LJC19_04830 [Oxalobacter sp. OttesenSCG-928-P03]|nr:hypothetical protein [Oxalobacter sp. OttesenSCG-928-P03]